MILQFDCRKFVVCFLDNLFYYKQLFQFKRIVKFQKKKFKQKMVKLKKIT